jgi:hypothetical protein
MSIAELREELVQVRELVLHGEQERALSTLDRALRELAPEQLLTTTEAANLLGIRSVNTLKLLLRAEEVPVVRHGNRTMIPLGEVERLQRGDRVRGLRTSARMHEAIASLGEEPVSQEALDIIAAGRPGTLPWER